MFNDGAITAYAEILKKLCDILETFGLSSDNRLPSLEKLRSYLPNLSKHREDRSEH
jgi:hypothetical protein